MIDQATVLYEYSYCTNTLYGTGAEKVQDANATPLTLDSSSIFVGASDDVLVLVLVLVLALAGQPATEVSEHPTRYGISITRGDGPAVDGRPMAHQRRGTPYHASASSCSTRPAFPRRVRVHLKLVQYDTTGQWRRMSRITSTRHGRLRRNPLRFQDWSDHPEADH